MALFSFLWCGGGEAPRRGELQRIATGAVHCVRRKTLRAYNIFVGPNEELRRHSFITYEPKGLGGGQAPCVRSKTTHVEWACAIAVCFVFAALFLSNTLKCRPMRPWLSGHWVGNDVTERQTSGSSHGRLSLSHIKAIGTKARFNGGFDFAWLSKVVLVTCARLHR